MIDEFRCLACSCTFETGCKMEAAEQAERAARAAANETAAPQNVPYHRIIVRDRPGIRQEALEATATRREVRRRRRASRFCGT